MWHENAQVVRLWMKGLSDDGIPPLDLCDERIEIGNVAEFMVQGPYKGHAGVRRWVTDAFDVIEDRRFELDEILDPGDGETVVSVQRALGLASHTGLDVSLRWAAVWTIRGGRAARIQGYASKAQALKAVGAATSAGPKA